MAGVKPIRFLCAGLGGYAWSIAQALKVSKDIELVAMCDPAMDQFPDRLATLREWGVKAYPSFTEMIASENADAVWLPLPIQLHLPFTREALAAGLHVVTEKPAAGCLQDVDAMIAARDTAKREVLVGFQDIYAAPTLPAKQAILEGAIGKITHATVHAAWPRDLKYFGRNQWAGRIKVGDDWVLDSPLQNAISHYLNLAIFLLGESPDESATPTHLQAELYRANDIENFDTCALRITIGADIPLVLFYTHAERQYHDATVVIHGTKGRLIVGANGYQIESAMPRRWPVDEQKHQHMFRAIASRLRGEPTESAVATLEIARIHTQIVNAASHSTAITPFDPTLVKQVTNDHGQPMTAVAGLEDVMLRCVADGKLPSELGDVSWATPGGSIDLRNYHHFVGPALE